MQFPVKIGPFFRLSGAALLRGSPPGSATSARGQSHSLPRTRHHQRGLELNVHARLMPGAFPIDRSDMPVGLYDH